MHYAHIFVFLLVFILGLGQLARALVVPYPILFVLGGMGVGFLPHLPGLKLDPNFIFFIFLPPLLYSQAFQTSWRDFRFYLRSIMLLAIGLVVVTTVAVAYTAHWLIPDFPLSAGFVLGAIISPPDAIAASAIARRLGLPRRVLVVLEGESLVNDATSLVIFKLALTATVATVVPVSHPLWMPFQFVYVPVGGIIVGLAVGWLVHRLGQRGLHDDPLLALTTSLVVPFLSYLGADLLEMSGVLAVVATGLYLGWKAPETTSSRIRLQSHVVWETLEYLLNGMVFVLIGLQLPGILHSMREYWWPRPFWYAVVINVVCVLVRFAWVFPGAYLPRLLSQRIRRGEGMPDPREVAVVAWSGMRGVVSLAAALYLNGYAGFPRNHLMQFLAFSVILTTLVLQGLTLPSLIRWLGLKDDGIPAREERAARHRLAATVLARMAKLRDSGEYPPVAIDRVAQLYQERTLVLQTLEGVGGEGRSPGVVSHQQLHRAMILTQRQALLAMRRERLIGDDVMHKIEHELDLDELYERYSGFQNG